VSTGYGTPTRIYITRFSLTGYTLSLRILFTNPDNIGVFPSFTFKAFGGTFSPPTMMGYKLMARHTFVDAFKTLP
jgi:hypothetical protein